MSSLVLIVGGFVLFIIAYVTYGSYLAKAWGIDSNKATPAHTMSDGVDYVAAKPQVLLGHHFSSIAGAGPITGPIQAAIFGWLPVVLWIVLGGIFFGGVHDFGSLTASMKHRGKSIGIIIEQYIGDFGKKLFSIFAWLTLLLVVAAFTAIVANTFIAVPEAASSSLMFMGIAVVFGYAVYRKGVSLTIATVFGVALLFAAIWLGQLYPLNLSFTTWIIVLSVYIFIASVVPVWILLQPRDYLNSFLLYAMMIGAFVGIIVYHPQMELAPFTAFTVETATGKQWLFPILFITVACGAISGFHSLVGSGTTSKQINNERDAKIIGYGGMLIECMLAIVAIITAAYITNDRFAELMADGGPVNVFSDGCGIFMSKLGIPFETGKSFVSLAVSAFALTSLDTATRLGRFIFQEFFEKTSADGQISRPIIANKYVATGITVAIGAYMAFGGYAKIWPIFGSANQLLAALALLALAVWMKSSGRNNKMFIIPMVFMFIATLSALGIQVFNNLGSGNIVMVVLPAVLFILAIVLAIQGVKVLREKA